MNDCFHPNPLQHGGSSQEMRMVPALDPATAPLDGRGMDDMVLFLEKYSELLNYFDSTNTPAGNWRPFISKNLSTILASISVHEYTDVVGVFYKYFTRIQDGQGNLQQHFKILFDIAFTLLDDIRRWNERLVLKTAAKEMFLHEINTGLGHHLRALIINYESCLQTYVPAHNFIDSTFSLTPGAEPFAARDAEVILQQIFKNEWWKNYNPAVVTSWDDYKTFLQSLAGPSIFGDLNWNDATCIQYASSFIRNLFTQIYHSYVRIITSVKKFFDHSVTSYPFHGAHNGLILSFLHLFGVAQKELNRLTDRHLNFYYKDVLRITRRPPNPDSAHVVFTIAKNIPAHTLAKGTALLAKDKKGNELIYKTTDTLTVNKSEISSLKSIFIDIDPAEGGVYAADVANSLDGKGKELKKEDPSWFAFGTTQSTLTPEERSMSEAETGFLIATPALILSEGVRTVTFFLNVSSFGPVAFSQNELINKFDLSFSGKKGWIPIPSIGNSDLTLPNAIKVEASRIVIKVSLDEGVDPIVPLDVKAHASNFPTRWPAVKCLLKKNADIALYRKLSNVSITSIDVNIKVDNAASCLLHSDQGSIDNKNPFMPFGPRPKKNSVMFFGSHEVFSKKVTSLTLKLSWLGTPPATTFYDYYSYKKAAADTTYVDLSSSGTSSSFTISAHIKDGEEIANNPTSARLFSNGDDATIDTTQELQFQNLLADSDPDMDTFTGYEPSLRRGFLKLTLTGPSKAFGHGEFNKVYTEQVIAVNNNSSNNTLPSEPYTPLLEPLKYSYEANESILVGEDNNNAKGQFLQIFPFGFAEQDTGTAARLFCPFVDIDQSGVNHLLEGASMIGIANAFPTQVLALYFEFSEGTEDSSVDPPGVHWSYLSHNVWKPLGDFILSDNTNLFLSSGVLKIRIPDDMNDDNTLMPAATRWLRVGTTGNHQAYPKLYNVFTNAVRAVYQLNDTTLEHLAEPLPSGSITKLQTSAAAIKKIAQPYPSFDGRTIEKDAKYYTRVSERLRHKNRAITIWDYEKIILEEFTYLYKVKCLNHTDDVSETVPGCVRLITIPDMSAKSTGNLFMPMISNGKRQQIKDHIKLLNCPFADLQVQNPQYEAIRVKCEVKIREGLDETEHITMLKEDVDRFLAPWAFEDGRGIDFGGKMHRSQIIYFMEKLDYVDFVTDFLMDVHINGTVTTNLDEVIASTSRSILTTERNHQIGTNVCAST